MSRDVLLLYRHDGLGQRVMAILRGMILCAPREIDLGFAWRPRRKVGGVGIDPARDLLHGIDFHVPEGDRLPPSGGHDEFLDAATRHFAERYERVYRMAWYGGKVIQDLEPTPQETRALHGRVIDASDVEVRPAPAVKERIDRVLDRHVLADRLGVHVRRGDVEEHVKVAGRRAYDRDIKRFVTLDHYYRYIDESFEKGAQKMFLCTESADVVRGFEQRYGQDAVLSLPLADDHRGSVEGMQDALAEMILLSRCREIVCSRSAFSRVAISLTNRPHAMLEPDGSVWTKASG